MSALVITSFVIVLIFLVLCSALFSFSEMAISSANKTRLITFKEDKKTKNSQRKKAERVIHYIENYNEHITAIVIFNNIVNVLFSTLATLFFTLLAISLWDSGGYGALLSFLITTPIVIVFGEIVPKQLAKKYPEKGTMFLTWAISSVNMVMKPVTLILSKIIKEEDNTAFISDEEINTALSQTTEAGVTTPFEQELIKRMLQADELTVGDIMVGLNEVVSIPQGTTLAKINSILQESNYTRYPVVDNKGNVVSLFSAYRYLLDKLKGQVKTYEDYTFTFSTFNIDENPFHILEALRHRREKMAIIIDDEDKFAGVIALEDIIELLVGEIYDEGDVEDDGVYTLNETSYILDNNVVLDYWLKEYKPKVKIETEVRSLTIEKWAHQLKGSKPKHGDNFTYKNMIIWCRKNKFENKKNNYEIDIIS